ncbi:HAMP domain-containing histidine kinase [Parabacteroides sp. OttesenSCG-928-J18]|nr:HAMP domain-containing histidine kinase [Parabacteroides sp. OttesenSCG-928-J18]
MRFCISILLLVLSVSGAFAQRDALADSVENIVRNMPESERLPYLQEEMQKYVLTPARLVYARLLYPEALRQHNEEAEADAIYIMSRHFYGANGDSAMYWIEKAEPLFVKLGRLEDICRMKAWVIYLLNKGGRFDEVLTAVEELRAFSDKVGFPEGREMADQAMADFYFSNNLQEDAERLYLAVIDRMEKRNAPPVKRYYIIRQLITRMSNLQKKLDYLAKAENLLEDSRKRGETELDSENPLYSLEYVIYRTYAHTYVQLGEYPQAWTYLQKADSVGTLHHLPYKESELEQIYYQYYYFTGDYQKAIAYVDQSIENAQSKGHTDLLVQQLKHKADMLNELGRSKEAYQVAMQFTHLKDSVDRQSFHETLANVRTEYEVERLEVEKERMEAKAKQSHQRMMFLVVGCLILCIVIVGLIYLIRIIKRKQAELKIAKEKAEESDQLKSAFLANMNHEIRTPLNSIVGFSQVLIEEEEKETRKEFARIIQHNNELLQRLIADVLDISKIESNSMSLIYYPQELPGLMKEVYDMIQMRIEQTRLKVKFALDPCEACIIETDRNRLIQILTNLLTNAMKHTPEGGSIRFGYELLGKNVRFYVEDTGEGIPEEEQSSIFDRFVQLTNGKRGVGLGLAICKGLVTKMGGSIWVHSKEGEGSTFYVEVPQKRPQTK